jgi:integrase
MPLTNRHRWHEDDNLRLEALVVLSITLGLRPGELRKLAWDHVDLTRGVVHVWRSAGKTGDTKTLKSKRSLILPKRAIAALKAQKARQDRERMEAWHATNLVFCREDGTMCTSDALNWRCSKMMAILAGQPTGLPCVMRMVRSRTGWHGIGLRPDLRGPLPSGSGS